MLSRLASLSSGGLTSARRSPKFVIWKSDRDGQFYFTLRAENGERIATSEGYTSKQSAENGIAAVKRCASIAGVEYQAA